MDMDPEVDEGTVTLEEKLENGERKLFGTTAAKSALLRATLFLMMLIFLCSRKAGA